MDFFKIFTYTIYNLLIWTTIQIKCTFSYIDNNPGTVYIKMNYLRAVYNRGCNYLANRNILNLQKLYYFLYLITMIILYVYT